MKPNIEKVKALARDLRTEEPRPAHEELGGFQMAARCLDKCRATIVGWQGDFKYNCPMDQEFLQEAGLDAAEFKDYVGTGATDEDVAEWIEEHSHAHT
jgi:hypothetical protein